MTKNNPKLIRLDHALKAISEPYETNGMSEHDLKMLIAARKRLKDLSTVDAAEVVHGRWNIDKSWFPFVSTCSECGASYDVDGAFDWNFCPSCGARMDLK